MTGSDKQKRYESLYRQIESVIEGEDDAIANMANASSLIHEAFGFWWTGFYIVKDGVLVLGPFQGPVACTRIPFGKGVCFKTKVPSISGYRKLRYAPQDHLQDPKRNHSR